MQPDRPGELERQQGREQQQRRARERAEKRSGGEETHGPPRQVAGTEPGTCRSRAVLGTSVSWDGYSLLTAISCGSIASSTPSASPTPLATITAAAHVRALGHEVALYDPMLDDDTRGFGARARARPS